MQTQLRSLTIHGGNGGDMFTLEGTPTPASFQDVTVNTGGGADTVRVQATSRPLTVNAGAGNDTFQVGAVNHTLDAIQGDLTIAGGADSDTLTLNDTGNAADHTFVVTADQMVRDGMAALDYGGLESLTVQAGGGSDTVAVAGIAGGPALALHGGGGINSLQGPDGGALYDVTATDAGSYLSYNPAGVVAFQAFGNLLGGTGNDTFRFANGTAVTGFVYGGGGSHNKVDYSAYQSDVYVNLVTQGATGTSFVWDIQDITGGAGNDILVGDGQSNLLSGGAGRDLLIIGGFGGTLSPDTLQGGSGEDILIAGWTYFDWDSTWLQSLRDQWAGAGSYTERMAALSPYLNADTVYSNWAEGNVLTGGLGDPDWFFLRLGADSHDGGLGEEVAALLF